MRLYNWVVQNKTLLAIVAGVAIILLGAGGIFLYTKSRPLSSPSRTVATVSPTPKETSRTGSLKDIFENAGNKMCTFDVKDTKGETQGTVYNSGTKAYGEISLTTAGKTQKTFVIRDADTFYMWGDSFPTGLKMTLSLDELSSKLSGAQPTGTSTTVAPSQNLSFKCSDWVVDSSKFTPPANIKFTDITKMEITGSPTGSGNSSQCSICNSLTGSAKATCLTQFNCK